MVASAGKLGPAYAGSRLGGLGPRQSASVAALINSRGLTELIVLNIGLADQIISGTLFTLLVLMALATTLATAPLLSAIDGRPPRQKGSTESGREVTGKEAAEIGKLQEGDR